MPEVHIAGTQNLNVSDPAKELVVGNYQVAPENQNDKELTSDPQVQEMSSTATFAQDYDKISIPDELFQEQSKGNESKPAETTVSPESATEESIDATNDESSSGDEQSLTDSNADKTPVLYTSKDGSEYTEDDIVSWKKDAENKQNWSKSNTEKAQEVADQRKAVEPFVQLISSLNKSEEFTDTLFEAIEDELGKDAGQLFKESLKMDNKDLPNPWEAELADAKDQLVRMESERALDKSMTDLQAQFNISEVDAQRVLDHAIKTHEETGRLLTLEESYKVMNFDRVKPEPKKKPSVPVNVKKNVGIKADVKKRPASYDEIDISSFFNT